MTDQESKVLRIAEKCRQAGMTLAGAAGVIANIEAESAFRSNNLQDAYNNKFGVSDEDYTAQVDAGARTFIDSAGYGYCQWTAGDRKEKMLRYHRSKGKSIGDADTQIEFMLSEMRGYSRPWSVCTSSNDAYQCGFEICRYYEIPANTDAQAKQRGSRALAWFSFLTLAKMPAEPSESTQDASLTPGWEKIPAVETWPPRTISERCDGWPEISFLQWALALHGYNVQTDGAWTDGLTETVRTVQQIYGLTPDGIVGPQTWAKLLEM